MLFSFGRKEFHGPRFAVPCSLTDIRNPSDKGTPKVLFSEDHCGQMNF